MDGKRIKESIREEADKISRLSFGGKLQYFGSYYLFPIVLIAVVAFLLISVLVSIFAPRKEVLFEGMCVNLDLSDEAFYFLTDDYLNDIGGDADTQTVNLTVGRNIAFSADEQHSGNDYKYLMQLVSKIESEEVDYMLLNERAYQWFGSECGYADLGELLTEDEQIQYRHMLVSALDPDTQKTVFVALDITDSAFAKKYFPDEEKVYLSAASDSPHGDRLSDFLEYLFGLQP